MSHNAKTIKLRYVIGENDFERRLRDIERFLGGGYTVVVKIIIPRGRATDVAIDKGTEMWSIVTDRFKGRSTGGGQVKRDGYNLSMTLRPRE